MDRAVEREWLLPCDPTLPRTARRLVAEATAELDRELVENALLLTSEIVTNVLRYGDAKTMSMWVSLTDDDLLIEVDDNVGELPTLRVPGQLDERGRGLILLDALASDWGASAKSSGGKSVWFRLHLAHGASAKLVA